MTVFHIEPPVPQDGYEITEFVPTATASFEDGCEVTEFVPSGTAV